MTARKFDGMRVQVHTCEANNHAPCAACSQADAAYRELWERRDELSNCGFCGSRDFDLNPHEHFIFCRDCGAYVTPEGTWRKVKKHLSR
jgi:hypothetical protein